MSIFCKGRAFPQRPVNLAIHSDPVCVNSSHDGNGLPFSSVIVRSQRPAKLEGFREGSCANPAGTATNRSSKVKK